MKKRQEVNPDEFSDVFGRYVGRSGYNACQLARLTDIPQRTVANWLEGRVRRPRERSDLLKLGQALHLNQLELNNLLQAADHPLQHEWPKKRKSTGKAPFQAVPKVPYFTGRAAEIAALKQMLAAGTRGVICSLQGMPGVGKSALAAHLAYALRSYFPDGVLWGQVDSADTLSILRSFAEAYGRDVNAYPGIAGRSQVVRELLADKRALIILDNVRASAEVAPLLPPSGASAVLLTTRRRDLVITSGVKRFELSPFPEKESLALFSGLFGKEVTGQERKQLAHIAASVGHLPLAVSLLACRLAYEPDWTAALLRDRLASPKKRLGELVYEHTAVLSLFDQSLQALAVEEQGFFTILGGLGLSLNARKTAETAGLSVEKTLAHFRKLHAFSLVTQVDNGRYNLHPLLRDYSLLLNGASGDPLVKNLGGETAGHWPVLLSPGLRLNY